MKKYFYIIVSLLLFVACDSGDDSVDNIQLIEGTKTTESLYADETATSGGINFRTTAPWRATVTEATPRAINNEVKWLTLSAYTGGAGEHHLTMTLTPNTTGKDRKAEVKITCGDTNIVIKVEQKGQTAEGEIPESEDPEEDTPEGPSSSNTINRIDMKEYVYEPSGVVEMESDARFEFFYNEEEKHLEKLVILASYREKDGEMHTEKGTVTSHYTHDKVDFETIVEANGVPLPTSNDFIMLDNEGRAVSGDFATYGDEDNPYRVTYEYAYDSDGFIKGSTAHNYFNNNEVVRSKLTWENGNLTKLLQWEPNHTASETKVAIITYGAIKNDTNIDLGRFLMLSYSTVVRETFFTDGATSLALAFTDYFGVRSKNLPKVVKSNPGVITLEYTPSEGRPTKISIICKNIDGTISNRVEMTITYTRVC